MQKVLHLSFALAVAGATFWTMHWWLWPGAWLLAFPASYVAGYLAYRLIDAIVAIPEAMDVTGAALGRWTEGLGAWLDRTIYATMNCRTVEIKLWVMTLTLPLLLVTCEMWLVRWMCPSILIGDGDIGTNTWSFVGLTYCLLAVITLVSKIFALDYMEDVGGCYFAAIQSSSELLKLEGGTCSSIEFTYRNLFYWYGAWVLAVVQRWFLIVHCRERAIAGGYGMIGGAIGTWVLYRPDLTLPQGVAGALACGLISVGLGLLVYRFVPANWHQKLAAILAATSNGTAGATA